MLNSQLFGQVQADSDKSSFKNVEQYVYKLKLPKDWVKSPIPNGTGVKFMPPNIEPKFAPSVRMVKLPAYNHSLLDLKKQMDKVFKSTPKEVTEFIKDHKDFQKVDLNIKSIQDYKSYIKKDGEIDCLYTESVSFIKSKDEGMVYKTLSKATIRDSTYYYAAVQTPLSIFLSDKKRLQLIFDNISLK